MIAMLLHVTLMSITKCVLFVLLEVSFNDDVNADDLLNVEMKFAKIM